MTSFNELAELRIKILSEVNLHLSERECRHSLLEILNFQTKEENGWKVSETSPTKVPNQGSSSLDRVQDRQEEPTTCQI